LVVTIAACGALATPGAAQASAPVARSAASAGVVYGGITPQGFPVMVELRKNHRRVVRTAIGLRLSCTTGATLSLADNYSKGGISGRKFHGSFGPETSQRDDGTTWASEGSFKGKLNASATKITGTWQLDVTIRDAAGNVTDTCDSGVVHWSAKQ
jgi:hypothetical protein